MRLKSVAFLIGAVVIAAVVVAIGWQSFPSRRSTSPRAPLPSPKVRTAAPEPGGVPVDEGELPEIDWSTATDFANTYPEDYKALVRIEEDSGSFTTTALGAAIYHDQREQIGRYIENGADLKRPIWLCTSSGNLECCAPAHMAIHAVYMRGVDPSLMTYLLEAGADANAMEISYVKADTWRRGASTSVLDHAVRPGNPALLRAVLEYGVQDMQRGVVAEASTMSPLFTAIIRSDVEGVRLLLEHGADPRVGATSKNGTAKTPLHFVREMLTRRQVQRKPVEDVEAIEGLIQAALDSQP